jgi:small-conductance mechanosensitive channel
MLFDLPFGLGTIQINQDIWEISYSIGFFCVWLLFAWIIKLLLGRVNTKLNKQANTSIWKDIINAITRPILLTITITGFFLSLTLVSSLKPIHPLLMDANFVAVVALVAMTLTRVMRESLNSYARITSGKKRSILDQKMIPPLRRAATISIYILAGMLILDRLGISISPLIAGLGIGGLAVALALQPTLSNFFAGTYLVSDGVLSPNDFIELEGGLNGYVVEIGWRSTRIRTPYNNLVIIPNSRLADSILTNYYGPSMDMGVLVMVGVSYSSDLAQVERVSLEVANEVIRSVPDADEKAGAYFGYDNFGDSNIDLWLWVQANDRIGSFVVKSELIKQLHQRFSQEGIEINYPMRHLIYPGDINAK